MIRVMIVLLFAAACSTQPKVPKNLLQPQKMQAIMLDLISIDSRIANSFPSDTLIRQNKSRYRMYQQVLALHGTNKAQFTQSIKFYEQHPPLLKEIVEAMDTNLDKQLTDTTKKDTSRRPLPM